MAVREVTELIEAVVGERIEPTLVAYVTPDEGGYSISHPLPDGLEMIWSQVTGRLVVFGTPTESSLEIHIITGHESGEGATVHITVRSMPLVEPSLTINTPSCLLYTSPSPRDRQKSRMPSSA